MLNNLPLNALQTFAIAAQEGNFTRAADILHITPSAVSHRIKALEKRLLVVLFTRQAKGVTLSQAGETLLTHINIGMKNIHQGMELCQFSSTREKLCIAIIPSLGLSWLTKRLDSFYASHPQLELDIVLSDQLVDFNARQIDAHIHFGSGDYYALKALHLADETIYPVCHPDLLAANKNVSIIQLLHKHPLLHYKAGLEDRPGGISWAQWFENFELVIPKEIRQRWFSQVNMCISAACYKQGITLGWDKIVTGEIEAGNLQKITQQEMRSAFNYYLVMPHKQSNNPSMQLFTAWITEQFKPG